jgi:hypothetical protein
MKRRIESLWARLINRLRRFADRRFQAIILTRHIGKPIVGIVFMFLALSVGRSASTY